MFEWWNGRGLVFAVPPSPEPAVAIGSLPTVSICWQGRLERLRIEPRDDGHYGAFAATIGRYKWVCILWRMPTLAEVAVYTESVVPDNLRPLSLWPCGKAAPSGILRLAQLARLSDEQWRWALWRGRDLRGGYGRGADIGLLVDNPDYAEMDLSRAYWDTAREAESAALDEIIADWRSLTPSP